MEMNKTCEDFLLSNSSTSSKTAVKYSCGSLVKGSQLKSEDVNASEKCETPPGDYFTDTSSSILSSGVLAKEYCSHKEPLIEPPNISYELAVAKSIMQQLSSISGENLFDHLSDIIKRVIDERPPNVIDFFEEFSRNVREQKIHLPERFSPEAVYEENRLYKLAKQQLISMKLPYPPLLSIEPEGELEEEQSREDISIDLKHKEFEKFRTFNHRVQHLQFYWNQCGLSISSEDIFQLACSMDRLQSHPSIMQCRFWGMVNGLKASYFIVEAALTQDEYEYRLKQMQKEMHGNFMDTEMVTDKTERLASHIGPELTPGDVGWENHPDEEISKMKPSVLPVPLVKKKETFDTPPEPIGKGVNRYSYFVVNHLFEEWIELPIVTPSQISQSRDIKKFFTGDLEEVIVSYPCFCGKEKHYLRAMIARITAGTYIAPKNYYRRLTKKERKLYESVEADNEEEEEEEESEMGEEEGDEENILDNDVMLLKNERYDSSVPLNTLNGPENWVHVRPNILLQGRVVWFDHEKAEREREKERLRLEKMNLQEEMAEDEENDTEDEEDNEEGEEDYLMEGRAEQGPAILTPCSRDTNIETSTPWVGRLTSKFTNRNERILVMQSNIWPGAYTFVFKDLCESIYLGWGHKLVSRNMSWKHLSPVEEEYRHKTEDFIETIDPSVQMEEAYKMSLLEKDLKFTQMDDFSEHGELESSNDEDDDKDDEDDEEEEE